MKKFRYTGNHKADEAYMAKMCHAGWAATGLVEGVWTFVPCSPDQYRFRVCYLRGKGKAEVEALKRTLAAQGIEFVSRYAFWAIFRSVHEFQLYTPEEEYRICADIRRPMLLGSVLSWLGTAAMLVLAKRFSIWLLVPGIFFGLYAGICTWLGFSYTRLLRALSRK